jgi:TatD DNase family protein
MIDSHVHLDFDDLSKSLDSLIEACEKVSVNEFIVPSVSALNFSKVISLSEDYAQIHAALGVHPWFVSQNDLQNILSDISNLISKHKVIAVGEIGLDKLKPNYNVQLEFFECQLQIAQIEKLPVIVHCVKAHQDVLRLLKKYSVVGVMHGWGGNFEQAKAFIEIGFMLGIGGAITYPERKKLRLAVQKIPLDKMVLETDAPAMPLFGEGRGNSPVNISKIANELAILKSMSTEEIASKLTENTKELFSI